VANNLYKERYVTCTMKHKWEMGEQLTIGYYWKKDNKWNELEVTADPKLNEIKQGSKEEFITEHYWGYTARDDGAREYQVEHPRWRVWPAVSAGFDADIATLYSPAYVEALSAPPSSAFIAGGSPGVWRRVTEMVA